MKRSIFVNLLVVVMLSGMMLAPAARPFIDPRATIRTIVTMQPASFLSSLPQTCQSEVTSVPSHIRCTVVGAALRSVDFDLILMYDSGVL